LLPIAGRADSWSSVTTEALLAELKRRKDDGDPEQRPACGSQERGAYDTPLHVFALFLILFLSTVACGFPLFSRHRSSKSRRTNYIIFICQHFGTGVLLATAFVHLLPTAFNSLTDPCLPYVFSHGYTPMAGLIAMVSALVVVALESYLTTRGAGHSHAHMGSWDSDDEDDGGNQGHSHADLRVNGHPIITRVNSHRSEDIALGDMGASQGLMDNASPDPASTPILAPTQDGTTSKNRGSYEGVDDLNDDNDDDDDLDLNLNELDPTNHETDSLAPPASHLHRPSLRHAKQNSESIMPPATLNPEEQKRMMLQCMLLEAGILFHSVFIGMAVSVATGPPFVVFLIAIAFHQTFEGLALGSRIAKLSFPRRSLRPWLMVLAYGCTTPLGQAIGLGVHTMYDPRSQTGLLMVGFMNAISSGLLLFAGLVQLLAEDFLTEKSYKSLTGKRRRHAGLAVLTGSALMALVGAFA
jgi:solute carrier family 39 (zinc transporter), member 1/2/3